jgi:replicative DNA helicase
MNGVRGNRTWMKDWPRLNGMLGGFHPGQLIVLAARPGIGKTALALNWILGAADYRRAAGIFSLEMPAERLWRRLAAAHAGIDLRALVETRDPAAFNRLGKAKLELDKRGIWIQDRAGITAREILGEVDGLLALQPDLGLLVVDHLGLISTPETARNARQNESTRIGEITRAFKILAGDRGIPVLLLTQLNREVEKRSGGKPQLSDLRDSGCVEQDADTVMFIHRKGHEPGDRSATLDIAKQREGPTGEIQMDWDSSLTRFREVERMTESSQPEVAVQEEWV